MLILSADADESVVATAVDRIAKVLSAHGGDVIGIDRWGRRRFAYELDHLTEGYYVVVNFNAEATTQAELERVLNLADEVIRYKVLVLPAKRATIKSRAARASTEAPREAPKEAPSEAPKEAPSEAPQEAPSEAPQEAPSEAPQEAPSEAPKEAPSEAPKEAPSEASKDETSEPEPDESEQTAASPASA
jgi:small subunit ribosomal protein S6